MGEKIQDGIYFTERFSGSFSNNNDRLSQSNNKTFALVFLEAREGAIAERIGKDLACLWKMYDSLKKGLISNLPKCRVPTGNLDILIGYGPRIFSIKGAKKSIPNDMRDMQFSRSDIGDEPICLNSGIRFAKDIHENLGLSEHVILQFTSETQLATYRAIVQTWRFFSGESKREISLKLTRFKTGFQRDDGRSWLGFHDPISNLRDPTERIGVIAINKKWNRLMPTDQWTQHGTYLAFLKIVINLEIWEQLDRREQELAIGRDKVSGRPILVCRYERKTNLRRKLSVF